MLGGRMDFSEFDSELIDFASKGSCEAFLMHGLEPSQYKPALRIFRRLAQVVPASEAVMITCQVMIDMYDNP